MFVAWCGSTPVSILARFRQARDYSEFFVKSFEDAEPALRPLNIINDELYKKNIEYKRAASLRG